MFKGLLGKKIGMTQIFDENGVAVPITVIEAGPCYVTQLRNRKLMGTQPFSLVMTKSNRAVSRMLKRVTLSGITCLRCAFCASFVF